MEEIVEKEKIKIEDMIYEIRGKQVMLDRDLAKLYQVETRLLNQKVKRNIKRFPLDFCFQMTNIEFEEWRSQNVMSDSDKIGLRRPPYVFTEQGIAMLSAIINSNVAIDISIKIIKTFIEMRKYISSNLVEQEYINNMVLKHDNEIKILQDAFSKCRPSINHIFFEGQIYDAYSLLLDIFESSIESIVIIDNYADKKLLDLLSKTGRKVKVYSKNMNRELIDKYQEQYKNVEIIENSTFHDRFIIIDNKCLYHCGSSFKELGKKCFAINKIEDAELIMKFGKYIDTFDKCRK